MRRSAERAVTGAALAALVLGCAAGAPRAGRGEAPDRRVESARQEARAAAAAFLEAARAQDFQTAWRLLAGPLQARYTPSRLAEDFAAVRPMAQSKLERAAAGLSAIAADEERASVPTGEGRALRLVREAGGWRVESLD